MSKLPGHIVHLINDFKHGDVEYWKRQFAMALEDLNDLSTERLFTEYFEEATPYNKQAATVLAVRFAEDFEFHELKDIFQRRALQQLEMTLVEHGYPLSDFIANRIRDYVRLKNRSTEFFVLG